jgi:hypothetical protein
MSTYMTPKVSCRPAKGTQIVGGVEHDHAFISFQHPIHDGLADRHLLFRVDVVRVVDGGGDELSRGLVLEHDAAAVGPDGRKHSLHDMVE